MDKDLICDFQNLYKAYRKTKSGKKFNGSCARFQTMSLEGLHILKEQLENQTYSMNPYNKFKIYEPKEREIKSCTFKDKVVQNCLCYTVLRPRLQSQFIRTNYAGQIDKGTHFGMDCLKEQMLNFYEEHGTNGWILKCDIRKFFYTIEHDPVKDIVDYYFYDEYTVWLNHLFIDSVESPGLPLGNPVALMYALLMLDGLDHFITGELGIDKYGRYSDDFYLICSSRSYAKWCKEAVEAFVSTLGLSLNGKTQIVPFRKGISFLGFHHYVTEDGKYIRKIKGENKRKIKKKLNSWAKAVKAGEMMSTEFYTNYNAWKNHALHGNCKKLCHSMDLYVEELLKGASQ